MTKSNTNNYNQSSILIVDDNPLNIQVVAASLKKFGCELIFARGGQEALDILENRRFSLSLILMDIMMPDITGIEVCRRLKLDARGKDIPVIFLTAKTDEETIGDAFDAGGVDYIIKPFNQKELVKRAEVHLKLNKQQKVITDYNNHIKDDLKFARKFQNQITSPPLFKNDYLKIQTLYHPSEEIGGDYLNYIESRDRIYILTADVTGHGLKASLYAFILDNIFKKAVERANSAENIFSEIKNSLVAYLFEEIFLTLKLVEITKNKKQLTWIDAGHPGFVHIKKKKARIIKNNSSMISTFPELDTIDTGSCQLKSGDKIIIFSDGLVEDFSRESYYKEQEIKKNIESVLSSPSGLTLDGILEVFGKNNTTDPGDDISLALIKVI